MKTPKPKARAAGAEPATEPRIEYVRLSDLKVAKRNPKEHDIAAIKAAILRYGMVAPIIEDAATGRIVAGHGRKEALEAIKGETPGTPPARVRLEADGEWSVPVVRGVAFKNEKLAEEYLVADNRLVEIGGWDYSALAPMFQNFIKQGDAAIAAIGFSSQEMEQTLAKLAAVETGPGEFPEVNPGTVTVQYCCPRCSYQWSGAADPAKKIGAPAEVVAK